MTVDTAALEALGEAIEAHIAERRPGITGHECSDLCADEIAGFLPEGWELHGPGRCVDIYEHETATAMSHGEGIVEGRQQERDRLRAKAKGDLDSFLITMSRSERALLADFADWLLAPERRRSR